MKITYKKPTSFEDLAESTKWLDSISDSFRQAPNPFMRTVFRFLKATYERTTEGLESLDALPENDPIRIEWRRSAEPESMLLYLERAGDFPTEYIRQLLSEALHGASDLDDFNRRMETVKQHIVELVPIPPTLAEAVRYVRAQNGW